MQDLQYDCFIFTSTPNPFQNLQYDNRHCMQKMRNDMVCCVPKWKGKKVLLIHKREEGKREVKRAVVSWNVFTNVCNLEIT